MAKIIYEFDPTDPNEKSSIAVHDMAWGMWHVLWNIKNNYRNNADHGDEETCLMYEKMLFDLMDLFHDYGVNLERVE